MPHIVLDFEPPQPDAPTFTSDTADLVYFLSWAFLTRYGASHDLSVAANVLRSNFKIDLVPLLTFADRHVEEPADEETLDRAWQDAAALAGCCARVFNALGTDVPELVALAGEYPTLRKSVEELGRIATWVALRGSQIRVTYELDNG